MTFPNVAGAASFDQAARAVLDHLRTHVPMGFWAVTRVENGRQSYLFLDEDNDYGLRQGGSHPWEDSFCIHMAAGTAPPIAPDAQSVPAYAAAAVNESATIGAYAGSVISEPDGQLFGAICGLSRESAVDDERLVAAGPLLQLLGQLLTMALAADRMREVVALRALEAELAAETDELTGLHNRRAWVRLLAEEELRFARFGDPTVIAVIDLDLLKETNDTLGHAAGDEYIRRSARALDSVLRSGDVAARLGGDEFGMLLRGCNEAVAGQRVQEVYEALGQAGVAGSVGMAPITVLRGFPAALADADAAMYEAKRLRRQQRPAPLEPSR